MKFLRFNSPKYFGQFDPPIDKVLHERYFKKWKTPGFFIECGAYDGVEESSCYFFEKHLGWSGLNVEAVPQSFNALQKNRPSAINVHCALSSENGEAEFRNAIHPQRGDKFGNGSLKHTFEHSRVLEEQGCEK